MRYSSSAGAIESAKRARKKGEEARERREATHGA